MSPDLDFPLRVASVDIGSNAIRLLAAEFADPGHWISLESRRAPVRLGHSAYLTGRLESAKIDMALEALLGFREIMDSLAIREHRVVATSAVRESRNRVERLAVLLRIADALDRKHAQEVSAVRVRVSRGQVSIQASAPGDLALEDWVLERKARPWFEETFGRKLVLLPTPAEPV